MIEGALLLAVAYATILATIVTILRIDEANLGLPAWHRLRLILTAWHFDEHPEVYRARYAVILTLSSLLLYLLAYIADRGFEVTLITIPYMLISRLAIVVGEVFAWSGFAYCWIFALEAVRNRQPFRLLIFTVLFAISFTLLFLHMFGLISIWPPVTDLAESLG